MVGIGLFRDLRGLCSSIFTSKIYNIFFDWIYPTNFHSFIRMFETWWDTPEVVIPMLRFLAEFIDQKSHRINFPTSSPNGIILFKETSKVLNTYGERILKFMNETDVKDPYKERYKGIMLCMKILSQALNAQYINFGVFKVYNDPVLQVAIKTVLQLVLSIKLEVLQCYNKVARVYYQLLEVLFKNHIEHLLQLSPEIVETILTSLHEGVNLSDTNISSLSARSLDYFFAWKWHEDQKRRPSEDLPKYIEHFKNNTALFREILVSIFMRILQEPGLPNNYALCCPVFSLICIDKTFMVALEKWLGKNQPADKQNVVREALKVLADDLELRVDENMRTVFSHNVQKFKEHLQGSN